MTGDIRKAHRTPFEPFAIRTTDGNRYRVPSPDHVFLSPGGGTRVIVVNDQDTAAVLPLRHISAVVHQANGE